MYRFRSLLLAISTFPSICAGATDTDQLRQNIGVSEVKYINVVREIAKPTALAPIRVKNGVKFMSLATNSTGEVVVQNAVIGFDHGGSFQPAPGTAVVVHVHNSEMSPKPDPADYAALREYELPCFIISSDGENIWEIAIIDGMNKFRAIQSSGIGEWVDFK
ncbi:hypothetical protein HPT27_01625 [Permianibacter sp. IMCC34836]|uniref:hypothetical protein n=1 Tax=Permianibacter fluminis TaxID=2738515 RepID=UPI0015530676|nr:hypothetical protein [Permianibacter fluminis]NQD35701.1 hypothetical protein [Permianibacter fluminis]